MMKKPLLSGPASLALLFAFVSFATSAHAQFPAGVVPRAFEGTGLMTEEIDGEGNVSLHRFGANGSLESASLPEGLSRSFVPSQAAALPPAGAATSADNPASAGGSLPLSFYSQQGQGDTRDTVFVLGVDAQIVEVREGTIVTVIERDANGLMTRYQRPGGFAHDFSHDDRGNLISIQDSVFGNRLEFTYDPRLAQLTSSGWSDTPDKVERFDYDERGNLTRYTSPEGVVGQMTYRTDGLIETVTNPTGLITRLYYDDHGQPVREEVGEAPGPRVTQLAYDAAGREVRVIDEAGDQTQFAYHATGTLQSIVWPDGTTSSFQEDNNQNLTRVLVAEGGDAGAHEFEYDGLNTLNRYQPPGGGPIVFHHDSQQRFSGVSAGGTRLLEVGFEESLPVVIDLPAPVEAPLQVSYSYQPGTALLSGSFSSDGVVTELSVLGDTLVGTTWSGAVTGSYQTTLDPRFRQQGNRINDEPEILRTYNADDRLISTGELDLSYDPVTGLLTSVSIGNLVETFDYDIFGDVASYVVRAGATTLFAAAYERDPVGRLVRVTETVDGDSIDFEYRYDSRGRLTEVRANGSMLEFYQYDMRGNLVVDHRSSGYEVNQQDQLIGTGSTVLEHAPHGERAAIQQVGAGTTRYHYSAPSILRGIDLPTGQQIRYLMDGEFTRVVKLVDGAVQQKFLYNENNYPAAELDAQNNLVSRFVYGEREDLPEYFVRNGIACRIIVDHVGSPRLIVDAVSGTVLQRLRYDAFGLVLEDTNPGFQPFGFAGGLYDTDTGLVRFGVRDYDAQTRRWTGRDPILFRSGTLNLYAYADNDPVNRKDPSGAEDRPAGSGREASPDSKLNRVARLFGIGSSAEHYDELANPNGSYAQGVKSRERIRQNSVKTVKTGGKLVNNASGVSTSPGLGILPKAAIAVARSSDSAQQYLSRAKIKARSFFLYP